MTDLDRQISLLQEENRALRAAVDGGALAEFVRYAAPFIREAIASGLWAGSAGVDSVEHETRHTLAMLDRWAPADLPIYQSPPPSRPASTRHGEQDTADIGVIDDAQVNP